MSKIVVRYISGKCDIFDTINFTSGEPYKQQGTNVVTEFLLRFDNLEELGLVAELYWYNGKPKTDISTAVHDTESGLLSAWKQEGCAINLVSKNELDNLSSIELDGEMVAWRQGGEIINGVKFNAQELLCYSSPTAKSLNARALAVFDYLKNANNDISDEMIANEIGFPLEVIAKIREQEGANQEENGNPLVEETSDDNINEPDANDESAVFDNPEDDINSLYENLENSNDAINDEDDINDFSEGVE